MNNYLLSLVPYLLYLLLKYRKSFHMLQQNSYNTSDRYIKWIFKNKNQVFFTHEFLVILIYLSTIYFTGKFFAINILVYLVLFIVELKLTKTEQNKKPLVITYRVKRLIFTIILLFLFITSYIYVNFNNLSIITISLIFFLFGYLSHMITFIGNTLNIPIELIVYNKFLRKAKEKLSKRPNLKVIGIAGSYGKTSSKNILNSILNSKYISFATPKSFNTPNGIVKTINDDLDKFSEIFIVEMGACKLDDINELCDIVNPKYGIITSIGISHLETFKTEENIQKGKFELIENLPKDGIAVLNKDDTNQVNYKLKNKVKIIWIGIDNKKADIYATDIKMSHEGLSFDVVIRRKKYKFETILLGRHNVYNILGSIALGLEFDIEIDKLQKAVKRLKPTEHRLELKEQNGIYIIDDAYNSNPVGSSYALEVLSMMPGKKIIVTPGMIELGEKEYELNKAFGRQIAKVCDEIILVGEIKTKPILDGIKEEKYNLNKVHIINNVREAYILLNRLKKGKTYALFENDLLDTYNER